MGKQGKISEFIQQSFYQLSQKHVKPPCTVCGSFSFLCFFQQMNIVNYKDKLLFFIVVALATDCPFCHVLSYT